jgi:uncharacterized protein YjbI with pentapeptide repeats
LTGANLTRASLQTANLEGARLHVAIMRRARLDLANLRGAKMERVTYAQLWDDYAERSLAFCVARVGNYKFDIKEPIGVDLREAVLNGANLEGTDLTGADLSEADLRDANLVRTTLDDANLTGANLGRANLAGASLRGAKLTAANLRSAQFIRSDLRRADLTGTQLVNASLVGADLTNARVHGVAAWDVTTDDTTIQRELVITPEDGPLMTVDDIEVAQFIYLLLNRATIRNVIDAITTRAVLLLGRFTPERKAVLDAIADELRRYNLLPISFDFERANTRDFTETIRTLASLSVFVIADITNPKSAPLELQATVPDYQIPFVPLIERGQQPFAMFRDLTGKYDWVLDPLEYPSAAELLAVFKPAVIDRAWDKHTLLLKRKALEGKVLSVEEFVSAQK